MAIARESGEVAAGVAGQVEQRVYASLVDGAAMRAREQELCRKLASLAQVLYEQRDLSDSDIDEIIGEAGRAS